MNNDGVHDALTCDDILEEILLRLPDKSVFKLILVSKRWLRLICGSSFREHYHTQWNINFHLLGFFVNNLLYLGKPKNGISRPLSEPALRFLPTCNEGDDLNSSGILKKLGYFIDSSNGLILCGRHPMTYYVWNPLTKQHCQLPQPRQYYKNLCVAFLTEGYFDNATCYKVIRAKSECKHVKVSTVSIEMFSSQVGTWKHLTLTCSSPFNLSPWKTATVINGVIHWFTKQRQVALYDTHLGNRQIVLVKLPTGKLSHDYDEFFLGESSDFLLQYGQSSNYGIEIWILKKNLAGSSSASTSNVQPSEYRWILRYRVSFKEICKSNLKSFKLSKEYQILAFLPQNSEYVVIRSGCDFFLCHLGSKKLEQIPYQGRASSISWDFSKVTPYYKPTWPYSSSCQST